MYRVEVFLKPHLPDPRGLGLVKDIQDLGINTVSDVRVVDIYWLDEDVSDQLDTIGRELLVDPVTHEYRCYRSGKSGANFSSYRYEVEVAYNPGVTDSVEETIKKAARDLGLELSRVKTARRYLIKGDLDEPQLAMISSRLLVNPIIQHVVKDHRFHFAENPEYRFKPGYVDITQPDPGELLAQQFGFSAKESAAIIAYFQSQRRNPTDAEVETLAQTWSEHCVHKTFRDRISLGDETIDNLLKTTIMKATRELNKPWCLSVFQDNAGVIDFDGETALCFKVETHNHPSAVEPYGGAATGIGGVVRDPLGTGLGAKPILNTDVFCFAPPDYPYAKLPPGVLHPRRIFKGVRAGVADYANRLGIPTLNGAILFDDRFLANPLVFCGTLGVIPRKLSQQGKQQPGDRLVVVGGRTGRDGIHGVTFASQQLNDRSSALSYSAVQIGNPIVEKKLIDVLLKARDLGLYRRITDCGGGGLSSAVGEMAAETGVRVELDKVPLKYAGLTYTEIWVSESQERMVLAVPPENIERISQLFAAENVELTVIGEFTNDRRLRLYYQDNLVCNMDMAFLHEGRPRISRPSVWKAPKHPEPDFPQPEDLGSALLTVLGSWNVCSKEWVIRQYDHEVQGGNVLKPLVGKENDGPGDAAIIRPLLDSTKGVIVANGVNTRYGDIDPYWMAASAIDEALRQIIAVGGSLKRVALLDNFCWGNTNRPEMLGALVRAAQACHDMALAYETPFISGKDSLNNEFVYQGKRISIPHTLLISALAVMDDTNKAISMDFKKAGNLIYLLGPTYNEMGGSEYLAAKGFVGNRVPRVNPRPARKLMESLSAATERGLVRAGHDLSDGGLGVALAEMAFAGGLGASIDLAGVPLGEPISRDDFILFAESNSRFLAEVSPEARKDFEAALSGVPLAMIGEVTDRGFLEVKGRRGNMIINEPVIRLKEAWQRPLRW